MGAATHHDPAVPQLSSNQIDTTIPYTRMPVMTQASQGSITATTIATTGEEALKATLEREMKAEAPCGRCKLCLESRKPLRMR